MTASIATVTMNPDLDVAHAINVREAREPLRVVDIHVVRLLTLVRAVALLTARA